MQISTAEGGRVVCSGRIEGKVNGKRNRRRRGGGEKESRRIVFVIKLTRMGLINLCESIKQVL